MGTGTELYGGRGVDEVNERLVEAVVLSLTLSVVVRKAPSETPVILISPDIRARRDRDKDRRGNVTNSDLSQSNPKGDSRSL